MTAVMSARAAVFKRSTPMVGAVELVLHQPYAAARVQPGQFFQLGVEAPGTLLRRPYSVSWSDPGLGTIAFLFSVVGAGSAWLARREVGQAVDLIGPLGHGFQFAPNGRPALCVAGGLGIACFPAVIRKLQTNGRQVTLLYGARTSRQLFPQARLRVGGMLVATDDGSEGHAGPVTDLLERVLSDHAEIFACGPTPMLETLMRLAVRHGIPMNHIQVALETPMGCGIGTCLGCAIPRATGGYLITCQEGPCVPADCLDWERMTDAFHD